MSKSYGNTIAIGDEPESVQKAMQTMMTDPARNRRSDPGNPGVCPVFEYHKVLSGEKTIADLDQGCRSAGIGCVECKGKLFNSRQVRMGPIYERRVHYDQNRDELLELPGIGAARARKVAAETMGEVRGRIKL